MSFSTTVKNEIILKDYKNSNKGAVCDADGAKAELTAFLLYSGKLKKHAAGYDLKIKTENAKAARRIYFIMRGILKINPYIKINKTGAKGAYYEVRCDDTDEIIFLYENLGLIKPGCDFDKTDKIPHLKLFGKISERKAFVKGAFLACGSVINPQKNYHLEFSAPCKRTAKLLESILKTFSVNSGIVERKSKYVVYIKNSDIIADVLTIVGAVNSLTEFHNAKILKEMRNGINRTINCENANMDKTVDASVAQVASIKKLMDSGKFDTLADNLKEIAILRLENRESSLKELGEMLDPPIGKSGVNHRLRKIAEIAKKEEQK